MSKAGSETVEVTGVDRVPAYLPQFQLPQAQLVFPTEASDAWGQHLRRPQTTKAELLRCLHLQTGGPRSPQWASAGGVGWGPRGPFPTLSPCPAVIAYPTR